MKKDKKKETFVSNIKEEADEQQDDEGYLKSDDKLAETDKEAAELEEEKPEETEKKKKKKEKLLKEAAEADNRGVCYLSRVPPHMDHVKLRQLLSQYGEILRIYLTPSTHPPQVKGKRPRPSKVQEQEYSEGWVEFARKGIAKGLLKC